MYKLIAIDLDGTLLNSYGVISEVDKNALKEAIKKGSKSNSYFWKRNYVCKKLCKRYWDRRRYYLWKWCYWYIIYKKIKLYIIQYIDKKKVYKLLKFVKKIVFIIMFLQKILFNKFTCI